MQNGRSLAMLLVLLSAGCGVDDYEAQLKQTRERLTHVDEENELLAEPVQLPETVSPKVFYRPPKGIQAKPGNPLQDAGKWLYRFPMADQTVGQRSRFPTFEVWVCIAPLGGGGLAEKLKEYLLSKPGRTPQSSDELGPLYREADLPEHRRFLSYKHMAVRSEEDLGLPDKGVYRYDVYVLEGEKVAIVFKQLDRKETEVRWKDVQPQERGWIPVFDGEKLQRPRRLSLSTLRVTE